MDLSVLVMGRGEDFLRSDDWKEADYVKPIVDVLNYVLIKAIRSVLVVLL